MAAAGAPAETLTQYEAMVQENIRRNRAVMEALGLGRNDARRHEEVRSIAPKPSSSKKGRASSAASGETQREAVRRSHRLAGMAASAERSDGHAADRGSRSPGVHDDVTALEGAHVHAKEDHLRWAGLQKGASPVGTASYEHTLHRVMTMSEAQLERRIRAIERACGQHAVAKMKLFATVLALEGYAELAEEATDAFQRLVEKLGMPSAPKDDAEDAPAASRGDKA